MVTVKEKAESYESPKTKNIADLELVSVDENIQERVYKEGEEDEFTLNVMVIDGEDYRVPDSVLKDLKALVEDNPKLTHFKVLKSGSRMKTSYTVVPLNK